MSEKPAQSLGEFLRSEREKRGLSVEQVSSATKIGIKILYALEADQYSELPALPFVRGFIRNYAKFIGLNSVKLLEEYEGFLEGQSKQRPNRDAGHSGYAFERPEGEQSRKMLWAIMGSMVVLGGLVVFVFKPSLKSRHHGTAERLKVQPSPSPSLVLAASPIPSAVVSTTPSATPSVAVSTPSPVPSPSQTVVAVATPLVALPVPTATPTPTATATPAPTVTPTPTSSVAAIVVSPSPSPSPSASTKPDPLQSGVDYAAQDVRYKVIIKALEDVTVRYQCDDKKTMRFTLKKDRLLVLRGKQMIRFQASNPESISYNPNGLGYRSMATSEHRFDHKNTASLIWPLKDREKIQENFAADAPLPSTAGPTVDPVGVPSPQAL